MAQISFKQTPVHTIGTLPEIGKAAPPFTLVRKDLSEVSLSNYKGKKIVINIFPSLDTRVCAMSVRQFHKLLSEQSNVAVIHVSLDLPFAMERFCTAESMPGAETLSAFNSTFGQDYGVKMLDGPLKGLLSRAIVIVDESGKVIYTEQVAEITHELNFQKALEALGVNATALKK